MRGIFNTGTRETVEEIKQRAWREQGMLVIDVDNDNMTEHQRQALLTLGRRRYGLRREEINEKRANRQKAQALWNR